MTVAIILSVVASFFWAITNHIDKFMMKCDVENNNPIKTLMVFSTLVAGIVLTPLWLILSKFAISISLISLICVLAASIIYIIATYLYFKALEGNEASIIVVMFQLIPVFSYLFAYILFKETLTIKQIIGSFIILLSAIIISINFKEKQKSNYKALLFMTLSCICYALYFILFDIAIRNSSYYGCAFWYQIGFLIMGLILFCLKSYRKSFLHSIKRNGKIYFGLSTINEILNLIANLIVNFANLILPLALVNVLTGLQGVFVFIIGIIGVLLFPKYFDEDLSRSALIQKCISLILGTIGLIILMT